MTLLLGGLFVAFQLRCFRTACSGLYSVGLAALWALGPVIAGVIVWRIQRNSGRGTAQVMRVGTWRSQMLLGHRSHFRRVYCAGKPATGRRSRSTN